MGTAECSFEYLLRELAPQVLGSVLRRFHDLGSAEDAVQEALLAAALQWPGEGIPGNPRGWLIQVAVRRMTDMLRSEGARRRREEKAFAETLPVALSPDLHGETDQDDTLTLFFLCCPPCLSPASAIALTLRAVGGLTTAEIGSAFLVPESTMAQRISRAKQSIRNSGVPFQMPDGEERTQRLRLVLHVLYLIFNEGYTASGGQQLQRVELAQEAIRLTRIVCTSVAGDAEATGLLALMLLTDARTTARTGLRGELIPLDEQDRAIWDRAQIAEGTALLTAALSKSAIGSYQLLAAIAALHDEAARAEETDWPQILALYDLLKRMSDNPMIALNHAIAAAMVHGPKRGLELLDLLHSDARVTGHHRLHAVRAHLLEMAGDRNAAVTEYRLAAAATTSIPERDYLVRRSARLKEAACPGAK